MDRFKKKKSLSKDLMGVRRGVISGGRVFLTEGTEDAKAPRWRHAWTV